MSYQQGRGGIGERAVKRGAQAAALAAGWKVLVVVGGALLLVLLLIGGAMTASLPAQCVEKEPTPELTGTVKGVPRQYVPFYLGATKKYKLGARGPSILAAIHKVESNFGANQGPSSAGAVGHMQFMPGTWRAYGVDANGDGEKDPSNAEDAIYAAANYLHASGAPGDWDRAIFAYNHADWYVDMVLDQAKEFGDVGEIADVTPAPRCKQPEVGTEVNLNEAIRVYQPREFKMLPAELMAHGSPQPVDSRIWPDVVWLLKEYKMRVTAAREPGHNTHGDGTAIDAVPATGNSIPIWNRTVKRAATDLGWRSSCASSGSAPACPLKPAIQFIGYNGYDAAHGDPAHSRTAHVHISWRSSSFGTSWGPPPRWVMVFPVPGGPQ